MRLVEHYVDDVGALRAICTVRREKSVNLARFNPRMYKTTLTSNMRIWLLRLSFFST